MQDIYKVNKSTWIFGVFYKANAEIKLPKNQASYFIARKLISLKNSKKSNTNDSK